MASNYIQASCLRSAPLFQLLQHWSKNLHYLHCLIASRSTRRYIAAELLELGSKNSDLHRRPVLTAKDICLAIRQDSELQQCFGGFEVGAGGRVNAHNVILDHELQLKE